MKLAAEQRLGPYAIEGLIGAGGMGEVYRARDTRLGRTVAIKLVRSEFERSDDFRQRFEREARANSALNHPNICSVYDVGEHEGRPFLVMEYIEGETLAERLRRAPMPLTEALTSASQVADALAAAHAAGIVHRDLKPANVKLTHEGRIKVLDFGLAKVFEPPSGSDLSTASTVTVTGEGKAVGTPGYMSPEQVRGQPVDKRTDVWAFGCLLYEMLTRCRAFAGESAMDTMAKVLEREPDWHPLPASASPAMRSLLRECLEKDPAARLSDMAEARRRLSEAAATARGWRPAKWQAAAALAIIVLAAAGLVFNNGLGTRGVGGALPHAAIRSLAVLPLANYTGDPEQEFFADGMTDELTSNLAKIGSVRVISRTSAMSFKGAKKPLKEIAKALGVDAVVEGSVLRSGDRVRITAQLIEASADAHLWSETYDRDMRDVLRLQSEVSQAIAREIKAAVTPEERHRLAWSRQVKPDAYETYLKAMFFINKFTEEGFDKGMALLHQAVEKDPGDPFAYGALGLGYAIVGHDRFPDALPRAKAAARRSLELGGQVPDAYLALAMAELYSDWDYAAAGRDLRKLLEISPNLAEAHRHYSWYLRLQGRGEEALMEMKHAGELEPLTPLFAADLSWQLSEEGQDDEAMAAARKALEVDPKFPPALAVAGTAYLQKGLIEQALDAHRKAAAADPQWRWPLAVSYALIGRKDEARKLATAIATKPGPMDQWSLGLVYTALGDKDQAFRWLEAACQSRFSWMPWVVNDPKFGFAPLFDDPRFKDVVRKVGTASAGI